MRKLITLLPQIQFTYAQGQAQYNQMDFQKQGIPTTSKDISTTFQEQIQKAGKEEIIWMEQQLSSVPRSYWL